MRRVRRLVVAVALVSAIGTPWLSRASAQQSDKQQQLQQELDENSAQTAQARAQLADAQTKRQQLDASVASLNTQVAAATTRIAAAQGEIDRLTAVAGILQGEVAKTEKKLERAESDVRRSAVLLYMHGGGAQTISLLGSTDGSGAIVEGNAYLQRLNTKRHDDARRVSHLKAQLADQQQQVAAKEHAASDARAAAQSEKDKFQQLAAAQQKARDAAAAAEQQFNARVSDLRAQQGEINAQQEALSQEIAAAAQAGDSTVPVTSGNGEFIWPVDGPITSPFGYRTDPVTGARSFHPGIDIGASCGTPIKAAGSGVVNTAGWNSGGYGNMTLINHGGGLATLYGHQSSIIVSAGQSVTQGQVIGYVGSTGKSTGCHLHFEVRVNGNPVDPMGYL